jgi:cytochrome c biogenesis protein ResB
MTTTYVLSGCELIDTENISLPSQNMKFGSKWAKQTSHLTQRIIYWTWWYSLIAHVCLHQLITNWFDQIVQTATYMETKKNVLSTREVNVIKI